MWVQLNDHLVPEEHARVSVFDRGFMYGDGVFETMRAYAGRVFRIDQHLDRLFRSAAAIGISLPRSTGVIASDVQTVIARNALENAIARIRISRGEGAVFSGTAFKPTYVVTAEPLPADLDEQLRNGVHLVDVGIRKTPDTALPTRAKHANYLNSILALAEATAKGADDAVMFTVDGAIAETSRANIFLVRHGTLWTPSLEVGILPGITRGLVLELAAASGLPSTETNIAPTSLQEADEVFVTNSVMGIVPARQWQQQSYPVPGQKTAQLIRLYEACVARELGLP